MDCGCNCFGIAASSKRPVKRYNLLVPDIFPKKEPPFREQLDASTERKLKKLYEYLEKNLNRAPKVSRRLARRVNKELAAQRFGYVQIAVAAYVYLLDHLRDAESALLAKEVVCQRVAKPIHFYQRALPADLCASGMDAASGSDSDAGEARAAIKTGEYNHSVVGALLHHQAFEIRVLGADLLAAFSRRQATAEYAGYAEAFVPLLCANVMEDRGQASGDELRRLQRACLLAVQEQIRLSVRTSASLTSLGRIVECVLEVVARVPARVTDDAGIAAAELKPSGLAEVTKSIIGDFNRLAQGPAEGKRLVESLLAYTDRHRGWDAGGGASACASFDVMQQACTSEQQQYLAFSMLVTHATKPGLSPAQQLSVVLTASERGAALPAPLATAAVVLAIKEWSPLVSSTSGEQGADSVALRSGLLAAVRRLAGRLADAQHLLEVLGGVVAKTGSSQSEPTAALCGVLAASGALEGYPPTGGQPELSLPQLLLQELTALMLQWRPEPQDLAHQILRAALLPGRLVVRDQQAQAILSAVWHQVTRRATPQLFAAASRTVQALLACGQVQSVQRAATMAEALLAEAVGLSPGAAPDLCASQRVAMAQLAGWMWARVLERLQLGASPIVLRNAEATAEICRLRSTEACLEAAGAAAAFDDDVAAEPLLESLKQDAGAEARAQAVLRALTAAGAPGSDAEETPRAFVAFVPSPAAALQPKGPGPWLGCAGSRSRSATGDNEASAARANKLRSAMRSQTGDQPATLPLQPQGIRTAQDFTEAVQAASQRAQTGSGPAAAAVLQEKKAEVLGIIAAVLRECSNASPADAEPRSVLDSTASHVDSRSLGPEIPKQPQEVVRSNGTAPPVSLA